MPVRFMCVRFQIPIVIVPFGRAAEFCDMNADRNAKVQSRQLISAHDSCEFVTASNVRADTDGSNIVIQSIVNENITISLFRQRKHNK